MLDDIEDWMERRQGEVGQFAREAEAAGRRAWNDATRTGQDALGRTQSELATLGAQRLGQPQTTSGAAPQPPKSVSGSWLDQNVAAKTAGGAAAQIVGNVGGVARGIVHSAEGLVEGSDFARRLLDPAEAEIKGPDKSAWSQLANGAQSVVDHAENALTNPAGVASDMQNLGHQLYVDTVPSATPTADTFGGEMARNFRLGANQGELGWDLGSLLFGGAASKALRLGSAPELSSPAKYIAQGFNPAQADYLAEPYEGMGHHFVPRAVAKALGLPTGLTDSVFNVLKPTGMSRGDFYELHYKVDPNFGRAGLPQSVGGGSWVGKDIGLEKYGPWASLWHGNPAPLNALVGAAGMNNTANFDPDGQGN